MKIYTKTGDLGETGLLGGTRVPKNHVRVEACGTIDEANDFLGLACAHLEHQQGLVKELQLIQGKLFDIGAAVATPEPVAVNVTDADIEALETSIDRLTAVLPELRNFILPGGCKGAAFLHVARSTVRQAERRVVTVAQHQLVAPVIIRYLNRLSDYLFTAARWVNLQEGGVQTQWHAGKIQ